MELRATVSRNVKALRLARGLTQAELAYETSLDVTYITRVENSRSPMNLTIDTLERLARGLGVSPLVLLREESQASRRAKELAAAKDSVEKSLERLSRLLRDWEP